MCGINMIIDPSKTLDERHIQDMNMAIRHRGPDGSGAKLIALHWANVWLGAVRLAIRGGEECAQPYPEGTYTLVYNGEQYDVPMREGDIAPMLHKLTKSEFPKGGMYAYCLVNATTEKVIWGRDAMGIKPLYMATTIDGIVVASSEVGGILASNLVKSEKDPKAINQLLKYRHLIGSDSGYQSIQMCMPGKSYHSGQINHG
jgi:asparagine synthase (glutamine-hydrolysing)